jgi:hypothetical protein
MNPLLQSKGNRPRTGRVIKCAPQRRGGGDGRRELVELGETIDPE